MYRHLLIILICWVSACQKPSPAENDQTIPATNTGEKTTNISTTDTLNEIGILTHKIMLEKSSLLNVMTIHFADIDGDKKSDLIKVYKDKIVVQKSDGEQFIKDSIFIATPFYGSVGTFFADVDGDSMADAIAVNDSRINNKITIRKSTGKGFLPNQDFTQDPFYGQRKTFFADVDGDGKADAIAINHNGVDVRKSDGNKFLPEERFITKPFYGSIKTDFADVDGDGLADAIAVNDSTINNRITVRKSNGNFFEPNEDFTKYPFYGIDGTFFCDVNGDLKDDVLIVNDTIITILRSNGKEFLDREYQSIPDLKIYFTDVTGDEKADVVFIR